MRFVCLFLLSVWPAVAGFQLDAIYSDHMVLQRNRPLVFEGDAPDGTKITVRLADTSGEAAAVAGRWRAELPVHIAGGPFEIEISDGTTKRTLSDVLIGDVWVCGGQSNMHMLLRQLPLEKVRLDKLSNPQVRILGIDQVTAREPAAQVSIEKPFANSWQTATPPWLGEISATGYFFGEELQRQQKIPIGIINASKGGSSVLCWLPYDELGKIISGFTAPAPELKNEQLPGGYYYGMIAPLSRFPIRGFAWYQGESDGRFAAAYAQLFPAMIRHWRAIWKQGDLPFVFVQVTASNQASAYDTSGEAWGRLREAQLAGRSEPHTGMAVSIDLGEFSDVHPQKKEPLARRLATVARKVMGEDLAAEGPIFKSFQVEGSEVVVEFGHAEGGLESREVVMNKNRGLPPGTDKEAFRAPADKVTGFTLCGADHVFHPADAKIDGATVRLSSPEVPKPVAVRYAFANFALANLYNKAGFPAEPFRTDRFPLPQVLAAFAKRLPLQNPGEKTQP